MDKPPGKNDLESAPKMEIERKYLLASKEDATKLEKKIVELFPDAKSIEHFSEISYYFSTMTREGVWKLLTTVGLPESEGPALLKKLDRIPKDTPVSVRLRERESSSEKKLTLNIKASKNPLHDTERIEIETGDIGTAVNYLARFSMNGVEPESIWHSYRRVYKVDENTRIDVQDVSGYGCTAEIESEDISKVNAIAETLGKLKPLNKELLDAMYRKYGKNWQKYYDGEGANRYFSDNDWEEIEQESQRRAVRNRVN